RWHRLHEQSWHKKAGLSKAVLEGRGFRPKIFDKIKSQLGQVVVIFFNIFNDGLSQGNLAIYEKFGAIVPL
ncbi:MAG: hypothetical protein R6U67_11590, partial [Sodalinema sp.]|uniref:hypothetical protein n=1 Tax=Sodalinema sp. TaxID=3080550 RepID=UPI00396F6CF6